MRAFRIKLFICLFTEVRKVARINKFFQNVFTTYVCTVLTNPQLNVYVHTVDLRVRMIIFLRFETYVFYVIVPYSTLRYVPYNFKNLIFFKFQRNFVRNTLRNIHNAFLLYNCTIQMKVIRWRIKITKIVRWCECNFLIVLYRYH